MNKKIHRKLIPVVLSFSLLLQTLTPLLVIPVYAEDSTPSASTTEVASTAEPTLEPSPELTLEISPTPTETVTPTATPELTPTSEPTVSPEPTSTPTPSPWTFEKVELNKEYVSLQNNEVKLIFTKLPTPTGNIKIEEITLTVDQIKQTGSLSDKAYDITSDMADGSFTYNLSLPIPESSKEKAIGVKFAEEISNISSAEKVENTLTKTDTSVSVTNLDHFTIFVVTGTITETTCVQPPSGTTNWWTGDGHANDITSGKGGTLFGDTTYFTGKVSQTFSFDGTGDYVQMPNTVGDFGSSPFTVDFWMNSNDNGPGTFIMGKSNANGGQGWDLRLNNNTIQVVGVDGWPAQYNFASDASVTSGAWHHIALTSTETVVSLYIDGVLKGAGSRSLISSTANPFRIGWTTDFGGYAFNGLLDEVAIFSRALSADEITAIYNAGSAGKCKSEVSTSTVEATPFNESAADVVVNEFVYNPSSGNEWIEIFNRTADEISLSGWRLEDDNGINDDIDLGGSIPAFGFLVFENSNHWLNNTGDKITLKDNLDNVVDEVSYKDSGDTIVGTQDVGDVDPGQSVGRVTDGSSDDGWQKYSMPSTSKGWFNNAGQEGKAPLLSFIDSTLDTEGISSNIGELDNPSATPDTEANGALYFEKTGQGKIIFEKTLNLSDQNTVAILQDLGTAMEMSAGHIKFDSQTAADMSTTGAKIYMYGLDAFGFTSAPDLIVKNDVGDILIEGDPDYPTISINDYSEGTLTFTTDHFTQFDVPPTVPSAPILHEISSPTNDTTPALSWDEVTATPEVTSYDVEIYDSDGNSIYDGFITTTSSSFVPDNQLPGDDDYTWSVRANNIFGSSDWSEEGSFSVDTISPEVNKLGDGDTDVILEAGDTYLTFNEVLSDDSKTAIQNALTAGADKTLNYSWSDETLTITISETTTFANDVVVNVSDSAGNTANSLLIVDSSLTATQISPDGSGDVTANSDSPEVVITDPNDEVTVTIDGGTEATIDVSSFITDGAGDIPQININSDTADIAIPATGVTGPEGWDGVIAAPTVTTIDLPVTSGETSTLGTAIEIGFATDKLSFDNAVRILLPGQAGKKAGYSRPGTAFTEITSVCAADNQATGDTLGVDGECKIDVGVDMVIWTKHFTKFASYTQTTNSSNNSGSGGGDGLSDGRAGKTPVCNDTRPGSAPILLSAVAGFNSVTLSWSTASAPTTYYLVTYGTKSGLQQYGNPNVGPAGTTRYTINGLSGGITYYFRVRAGNGCATGDFSNELSSSPLGGFIAEPPAGFEPGVLGATIEGTDQNSLATQISTTPSLTPTGQVLADKSENDTSNMSFFWLLLFIPLYFVVRGLFKKK